MVLKSGEEGLALELKLEGFLLMGELGGSSPHPFSQLSGRLARNKETCGPSGKSVHFSWPYLSYEGFGLV